MSPRVALIGASGLGLWHRRVMAPMQETGRLRLVGLCDVRAIEPTPDAPIPDETGLFSDYRELLNKAQPDVVVICTPPHTHLGIATDVLRAGCDILLEKPPVMSLAEHRALTAILDGTGRACQVGFQALGSAALAELTKAIAAGRLGTVTGIGVAGSWQRDDAYYRRSPWAGRRAVDGRPVLDGAVANPFAHALMQSLALTHSTLSTVEIERYRARPIEVDDTACLRVTFDDGPPVVLAVTLCGEGFIPGEIIVDGTAGRAVLEYPTDRLQLPGDRERRSVLPRVGLLENLLDHRVDQAVPLVAPLSTTEQFTVVLEAIQAAPEPALIGDSWLTESGESPARRVTVTGVNEAVRQAAEGRVLFSEQAVTWAEAPYVLKTDCK